MAQRSSAFGLANPTQLGLRPRTYNHGRACQRCDYGNFKFYECPVHFRLTLYLNSVYVKYYSENVSQ